MEQTLSGGAIATVSALVGHCCIPTSPPIYQNQVQVLFSSEIFNKTRKTKHSFQTQPGKPAPKITFQYVIKQFVTPKPSETLAGQ